MEVNYLSSDQYSVNENMQFKTSKLRSHLRNYSNAHIVVKGTISITGTNNANRRKTHSLDDAL